ncbi:MAG: DUF1638 domain-containing protein [Planctomycetes bacterium]|nr:DUF1638 domain-containing protein [Planctomycetota bacterium]
MPEESFAGSCVVSCGTLRQEMHILEEEGFLDPDHIYFTAPGLHEWPRKLEEQLHKQLEKAKETSDKVIVAYGGKCFVDLSNPSRDLRTLIKEHGPQVTRLKASNCIDMMADAEERESIAGEDKIYWLTPGWVANWKFIFKDWDAGLANETFPQNSKAIILDAYGYYDELIQEDPELLLGFSDFMKIPVEPHPVTLDRLRQLLLDELKKTE